MSNFKVSEKVVCVRPVEQLIKGEIYTIESIIDCPCGMNMISILEMPLSHKHKGSQCKCLRGYYNISLFKSDRFRKLDTNFANEVIKNIIKKENKEPFRELLRELTEPEISK